MFTAVVFDLFGTLLSLERNGDPVGQLVDGLSREQVSRVRTRLLTKPLSGLAALTRELGLSLEPSVLDSLTEELARDVGSARLYPDTEAVLGWLRAGGVTTLVVSNLASPYRRCMSLCGLDQLIDHTVFSCDVGLAKPDARIFGLAQRLAETEAENCLMVGDSRGADVDGSRAAGMTGLHLVRSAPPDFDAHRISSLHDVKSWIG